MGAAEQAAAVCVYTGDCAQLIRNIILAAMSAAGAAHLKEHLQESLPLFYAFERMSTEISALIHASNKELHHEGTYAKGRRGASSCHGCWRTTAAHLSSPWSALTAGDRISISTRRRRSDLPEPPDPHRLRQELGLRARLQQNPRGLLVDGAAQVRNGGIYARVHAHRFAHLSANAMARRKGDAAD
eukprot:1112341-Pleurochrysis_carterae.AAC.1